MNGTSTRLLTLAMKLRAVPLLAISLLTLVTQSSFAERSIPSGVVSLIEKMSDINLNHEIEDQELLHKAVLEEAEAYLAQHKDEAEAWIIVAISRSSYARTQGMSALGLMKDVRKELDTATEIDATALGGLAQAFLGRVYFMLPAWPISYGSDKKAKKHLEEAMAIDSSSMENQYYYGAFWLQQKKYDLAEQHLSAALDSQSVIDTPNWLANMKKQIGETQDHLDELKAKQKTK